MLIIIATWIIRNKIIPTQLGGRYGDIYVLKWLQNRSFEILALYNWT
jgi:hypothetical protein